MPSKILNGVVRRSDDDRDYKFEKHIAHLVKTVDVPDEFDLSTSVNEPPIADQGQKGACGAFSGAGALGYINNGAVLSPEFIYDQTRSLMGTLNEDSGVDNRTLASVLVKYGTCLEKQYPYTEKLITVAPSDKLVKYAQEYKALKYVFVDGIDQIMQTMVTLNTPVIFGMEVFSGFESDEAKNTGLIPMPSKTESGLGGHDQEIMGWNKNLDFGNGLIGGVKVRNSWGKNYFQSGYEWIPFAYFDSSLNYVFDSFVVMKNDTTVVSPTTTKRSNGFLSLIFAFLKSLFSI